MDCASRRLSIIKPMVRSVEEKVKMAILGMVERDLTRGAKGRTKSIKSPTKKTQSHGPLRRTRCPYASCDSDGDGMTTDDVIVK